jgi:hypothetical protein
LPWRSARIALGLATKRNLRDSKLIGTRSNHSSSAPARTPPRGMSGR